MGTWIYFREGKAAKGYGDGRRLSHAVPSETVVLYMPLPLRFVKTMGSFTFTLPLPRQYQLVQRLVRCRGTTVCLRCRGRRHVLSLSQVDGCDNDGRGRSPVC